MATLADLKAELEPFKNTLVIDDSDTVYSQLQYEIYQLKGSL